MVERPGVSQQWVAAGEPVLVDLVEPRVPGGRVLVFHCGVRVGYIEPAGDGGARAFEHHLLDPGVARHAGDWPDVAAAVAGLGLGFSGEVPAGSDVVITRWGFRVEAFAYGDGGDHWHLVCLEHRGGPQWSARLGVPAVGALLGVISPAPHHGGLWAVRGPEGPSGLVASLYDAACLLVGDQRVEALGAEGAVGGER